MQYSMLIIFLCLGPYCVINWWVRIKFVVDGYKCTGSYKKKNEQYKRRWSLLRRVALFPLFSSDSTPKFIFLGAMNYCHFFLTIITICGYITSELCEINGINWQLGVIVICCLCLFQTIVIAGQW